MRILSIHIEQFGMLENRDFTFSPGMNILEGQNESGKSTLQAFIKFIFYGMPARSAAEGIPDRTRYLNWNTGRAAGSMTVACERGEYRIERSLARTQNGADSSRESVLESLQIIDLTTGSPLPRGTQPGDYFFGVPATVFDSTAFVRQLGAGGVDGSGVSEALENLMTSASESSNTGRALTRLDSARKALLHKNGRGGEIFTLQAERTAAANRLARAKEASAERIAAQSRLDSLVASAAEAREKLATLTARCDACDALMLLRRFESLHALENKTAELRAALADLHAREGAGDFFPDRAYAAALRDLERRIAAAESDLSLAETDLARMRYEQPGDRARAGLAAEIRTAGGIDALTGEFDALTHSAKALKRLSILCFILGTLSIAAGIALVLMLPSWTKAGCAIALIGLPLLASGIAGLSAGRRRLREQAELCRRYGFGGEPDADAFAEWLSSCFGEEEQLKGYEEVLEQVQAGINGKQAALDALRSEALDTLSRWKISVTDGGLAEALSAAIPRAERDAAEAEELCRDLAKYEGVCRSTADELSDQDEAALRRRVDALGDDPSEMNLTTLRREREFCTKSLEAIEYRRIETEKQLIALEATTEDPIKLAAKVEELDRRIDTLRARHEAICLAAESITAAAESLRRGVLPSLRERAGELLSTVTDGRYAGVGLGSSMAISVETGDATRPVELLSGGTGDAAYLSLRLALLELLFPGERPPILLDESLAQLDDTRAAAMLRLLGQITAEGGQCLLFTCHTREARMTEAEHIRL